MTDFLAVHNALMQIKQTQFSDANLSFLQNIGSNNFIRIYSSHFTHRYSNAQNANTIIMLPAKGITRVWTGGTKNRLSLEFSPLISNR